MKKYFITIDTETTQDGMVADFAAVITDKKGNIITQCAVLIDGIFTDMQNHPLFFTSDKEGIWSKKGQDKRYKTYSAMVSGGSRMVASVAAINRWLEKAAVQYKPILTAYNLAFDLDKCKNTGIDLTLFPESFCLWQAAYAKFAHTKAYRQFILDCHGFNPPTQYGNMTFKTNAEIMTRFITNNPTLEDEPHTALEDIIFYELKILNKILSSWSIPEIMEKSVSYNWRDNQVKDWYKVK